MWPKKEKVPNLLPYSKLQECFVTVLLLTSTPLDRVTIPDEIVVLKAYVSFKIKGRTIREDQCSGRVDHLQNQL